MNRLSIAALAAALTIQPALAEWLFDPDKPAVNPTKLDIWADGKIPATSADFTKLYNEKTPICVCTT